MPLSHEEVLALVQQSEGLTPQIVCAKKLDDPVQAKGLNALLKLTTSLLADYARQTPRDDEQGRIIQDLRDAIHDLNTWGSFIPQNFHREGELREKFENREIKISLHQRHGDWVTDEWVAALLRETHRTLRLKLRDAFAQSLLPSISKEQHEQWIDIGESDPSLSDIFSLCCKLYEYAPLKKADLDEVLRDIDASSEPELELMALFVQTFAGWAKVEKNPVH